VPEDDLGVAEEGGRWRRGWPRRGGAARIWPASSRRWRRRAATRRGTPAGRRVAPVVGRGGVVGEVEVGAVLVRGGEDAAEDGLGAGLALLGRDAEVAEAVLAAVRRTAG
jgi:hypothetical protein